MMRVIITGGTGLIGQALAVELAGAGYELILLSRKPAANNHSLPTGVRLEQWDGRTATGWGHLANGAAAIVNLAGENIGGEGLLPDRWTAVKKQRIVQSRLDAAAAVVAAVRAANPKPGAVIQASAVGYYGPCGDELITEQSPAGNDFLAQVCTRWEAAAAPVEADGVRRAVIRTGLVLSRQGGPLPRLITPFKLFAGGPLGHGRQWWPWIHIEDEVRAIHHLIEKESAGGVFNLTAPQPVRNADFARTLGRVLGRPSIIPAPAFALRLALGEAATIVLDGQRAVPQQLPQTGFTFHFTDLETALRDLV
jgi:uncharacterized protein